jgi:hypothetical protein
VVPVTAAPVNVPTLLAHVRNFLGQAGNPVRDYELGPIFGTPAGEGLGGYSGAALPGVVDFPPEIRKRLAGLGDRYGQRGPLSRRDVEALRVAVHEGVHQMRYGRTPDVYVTQQGRDTEEGVTEAMTQDLLPILTAKLFGHRMPGAKMRMAQGEMPAYDPQVTDVRQLSVFGSGARTFTDQAARRWRRQLLHADAAERQSMVDQARQARIAWGERTGR